MKKFLLMGLLFISLVAGCKKDKDPAPELAARASGTFTATKFIYGGVNIPLVSGTELTIILQKATAETINATLKAKIEGEVLPDESVGPLTVKDAGSSGVDLYEGSSRVGNLSKDNQLTLSGNSDGFFFEIIAQKQ